MSHTDKQRGRTWQWKTSQFEGRDDPTWSAATRDTESDWVRGEIERYMTSQPLRRTAAGKTGLSRTSLAVTVGGDQHHRLHR